MNPVSGNEPSVRNVGAHEKWHARARLRRHGKSCRRVASITRTLERGASGWQLRQLLQRPTRGSEPECNSTNESVSRSADDGSGGVLVERDSLRAS